METFFLIIPLALCLSSAIVALIYGLAKLHRNISITQLSWLVSIGPISAFIIIALRLGEIVEGERIIYAIQWMPSLGIQAIVLLDGLSALFALLVTGIGALVIIYSGYYFKDETGEWKFITYMMLFMTSMLGMVMAGDIISLFVFWEGTSLTSYLLIGYKYKDPAAQRGAFKALYITGGGGIALLAGLLLISHVTGNFDIVGILNSGEALRESFLYPAIFILIVIGAFTKSAQFPAHIWLPDAMSAPTPASAYLHSATMVKAGIYLLARMNPVIGFTDIWFWVLSLFGLVTMLVGAYLGLKQNDLKALLAYSTVSQLGVLVMFIGQDTDIAFKALIIGVIAHALYKCALFLVAGIVDHETGTRDLRKLGGIRRAMPYTLLIGAVAALSMAGLPPLFGFLAKETLLATAALPSSRPFVEFIFPLLAVVGGALILAQAAMFIADTFFGAKRDTSIRAHDPPYGMLLAPAIPAVISLALGALPEFPIVALMIGSAAAAAYGAPVPVSLALWTGINIPLILSGVAVTLGTTIFAFRHPIRRFMGITGERFTLNELYAWSLKAIDAASYAVTRVQNGKLRFYLVTMLLGLGGLILYYDALPALISMAVTNQPPVALQDELVILRFFALLLIIITSIASVVLKRDLPAVLALGVSGLSVALLMVLEPAPDVALVQVVVDILLTIILVLLLARIPRKQRERAAEFTFQQTRSGLLRDAIVAVGSGLVITLLVFSMLTSRPRESVVTPFFEENAKPLTGATDIVGAIIVDFRAFDTLIEIAVFGMGGIGVYTLLRYASRKAGDEDEPIAVIEDSRLHTLGIGGLRTSPFIHMLAYLILPLTMVISITHIIYGHDQPGDGFTAGVMISLAVGFWYVVFGYDKTKERLRWLQSNYLIGAGLLLALGNGIMAALITGSFFAPVDFTGMVGIPLPAGFHLGTSLFFEIAIGLTVLGSASLVIDTVGRPKDDDPESIRKAEELAALEKRGIVTLDEPENVVKR
jgi:multicomponent K+:H+ antiporter subunit A